MSTEYPTLAEVAAIHVRCDSSERIDNDEELGQHIADEWRDACTIRTVEQLDALPIGSVVRTTEERVAVKTGERWGNQSGYGSWWSVADEDEFDLSSDELDDPPALLIFHPDWSK